MAKSAPRTSISPMPFVYEAMIDWSGASLVLVNASAPWGSPAITGSAPEAPAPRRPAPAPANIPPAMRPCVSAPGRYAGELGRIHEHQRVDLADRGADVAADLVPQVDGDAEPLADDSLVSDLPRRVERRLQRLDVRDAADRRRRPSRRAGPSPPARRSDAAIERIGVSACSEAPRNCLLLRGRRRTSTPAAPRAMFASCDTKPGKALAAVDDDADRRPARDPRRVHAHARR